MGKAKGRSSIGGLLLKRDNCIYVPFLFLFFFFGGGEGVIIIEVTLSICSKDKPPLCEVTVGMSAQGREEK
eukprot:gene4739-3422_t